MLRISQNKYLLQILVAIFLGIISRVALFFGSMIVPIPNEQGLPISPLTANSKIDLGYYFEAQEIFFGDKPFIADYLKYALTGTVAENYFLPGPIFPSLLYLFKYGPDNSIPLSTLYLFLSIILVTVWLWWLGRNGVGQYWLYIFALLPAPIWYMLNISTDLLFAIIICAFWLVWFNKCVRRSQRMIGAALILTLGLLLRPNSLSLSLFFLIDVIIWEIAWAKGSNSRKWGTYFSIFVLMITATFSVYFAPYFWNVVTDSSAVSYFGISSSTYLNGLWPSLPNFANIGLSWLSIIGAKLLYASGLRASFGDAMLPLVFLRMLPGFVVLPGMIWVLVRASWREKLFVLIFLGPIFLGVTQDRYVFPILPILFFYGMKAWQEFIQLLFWFGSYSKRSKINLDGVRGSTK